MNPELTLPAFRRKLILHGDSDNNSSKKSERELNTSMEVDDIINYTDLVQAERGTVQKGMNYRFGKTYSVFLMSLRKGAPYADGLDPETGFLIYEGHDEPKTATCPVPKNVDQPLLTPKGSWTENGKFFRAAKDFASGLIKEPELIKVYEKITRGIWCYKGFFELVGARIVPSDNRKVFKFELRPVKKKVFGSRVVLPVNRLIPSHVKQEVWKRDHGRCVLCGEMENLHFDHDIPFSKGGSSLTAANVRLLCVKHNLQKSDKIISVLPWLFTGASATGATVLTN